MSTESTYYTTFLNDITLSGLLSNRIYPIRLPQNVVYPSLIYRVDSAEVEGELDVSNNPNVTFEFENMFFAESYSDIIAITEAIRDICEDMNWNITSFNDVGFDSDLSVFGRYLTITINSNL